MIVLRLATMAALIVVSNATNVAVAHADPLPIIECPYSHAHVYRLDQCPTTGPVQPIPTGGGHCGLICGVGKLLGGAFGL